VNRKKFFEDFLVSLIIGIIFLFIDNKISIGILVGYGFSIINYKMIEYRYYHLEKVTIFTYIGIFLSIGVLVLPLMISFIFPGLFSWIGVAIGLFINRTRLIIEGFLKK